MKMKFIPMMFFFLVYLGINKMYAQEQPQANGDTISPKIEEVKKSIDLLKTGNWDEIRRTLDEALKAGNEKNLGCEYFEADPEKRYTDNPRCPIPTGLQVFDDLFGGLGKGELGIIAAPPGIGKSTLLRYIAKTAVEQGKRVLLYTLELYEDYIAKKFDTLFTGLLENEIMENMDSI